MLLKNLLKLERQRAQLLKLQIAEDLKKAAIAEVNAELDKLLGVAQQKSIEFPPIAPSEEPPRPAAPGSQSTSSERSRSAKA